MARTSWLIVISLLFLSLTACAPRCALPTIPIPSCHDQCTARFKECLCTCQNSCPICTAKTQAVTDENYHIYIARQRAQGLVVARERDSYKDPLACTKVTCNCVADYDLCKQRCSGKVKAVLQNPGCMLDRSIWAW